MTQTPGSSSASGRALAVVTGASSGIGFELAKRCAAHGFELVLAADEPLDEAVDACRRAGAASVDAVVADLAAIGGVDSLVSQIGERPVEALLANAGHGLGQAFFDQDFDDVQHVIDTNITGTIYLIHRVGRDMRSRGPSITGPRHSSIPSRMRCATSCRTRG
jgi:short-subunit dehydrogenase